MLQSVNWLNRILWSSIWLCFLSLWKLIKPISNFLDFCYNFPQFHNPGFLWLQNALTSLAIALQWYGKAELKKKGFIIIVEGIDFNARTTYQSYQKIKVT